MSRAGSLLARIGELRALLDEVTDVDWRHPSWWGFVGGVALLERFAAAATTTTAASTGAAPPDVYGAFLAANGGPRSDTFMARDGKATPRSTAQRIALAVIRARAAADTIEALDGTFPGQPLRRALAVRHGLLTRHPLPPGPPRVVFLTSAGAFLAPLDASEARLAEALGAVIGSQAGTGAGAGTTRGVLVPAAANDAAIAVSLEDEPLDCARHLHRRAFTPAGGPWLGVGDAGALELVTTCHLAVDGYGHARIASELFARVDRRGVADLAALAAFARDGLAGSTPVAARPVVHEVAPLGFTGRVITGAAPPFAAAAYAFGRALERCFRAGDSPAARRRARHSPTFQVPIAPGDRDDPDRLRRRVLFGLTSVPMRDGDFVPFERFASALRDELARERDGAGLLNRVALAAIRAPLPAALRRRLLVSDGRPRPLVPAVATLAGRGCLSALRFPDGERPRAPLYAASSPGLAAAAGDERGGVVLTIIHHDGAYTASACGTGLAGTPAGARAFLDGWLEELEAAGDASLLLAPRRGTTRVPAPPARPV